LGGPEAETESIQPFAAPWREVLYLDSDSIPARDPEYMFEAPSYKRLGLWATPDYWKTSGNNGELGFLSSMLASWTPVY
jgi:hypothetical protein